jgi:hypothetical protein
MAYTQADLDLVNRHVADGARCVAQIEKSIAHAVTMALMIESIQNRGVLMELG